ncbi:hypothetical protein MBSD_n1972 [Mizugakiibacter sediminis]|uniref:Uncharacterized protein n=2 Tax=Mizugakiibacter sediminis TaxID=1475481 RepID=A0A0K8QPR5_9GAMM|nr:hypothetical protein MBSD_n1972 [Mizugakiibacter sediminis]
MLLAALLGMAAAALAQPAPKAPPAAGETAPIYGCMLMTPQERADYLARMRAAATPQQREAIRLEHHKQMQERARQRGVTLPEMPAAGRCPMGGGMGPGMMGPGAGKGMGPGMMGPARAASAAPAPAKSADDGH